MKTPGSGRGIEGLSESIAWLMKHTIDDAGRTVTTELVAYRIQQRGVKCSAAYITSLRSGRRSSPSAELLHALGAVAGVPLQYFTDSTIRSAIQADGVMTMHQRQASFEVVKRVMLLSAVERSRLLPVLAQCLTE